MKATILKNKVVGGVAVTVTICTIAAWSAKFMGELRFRKFPQVMI